MKIYCVFSDTNHVDGTVELEVVENSFEEAVRCTGLLMAF